jgi:hypothetical protein
MSKLSVLDGTLAALACVAVIYGTGFVVWRTLQMSRTFASVDRRLETVTASLLSLVDLRLKEQQDAADRQSLTVPAAALNIVFDRTDVFNAGPGEIGIGVFTLRNVGNDAVFLLGITRTPHEAVPQGPARLLAPVGERDLNLRLDPGDPPLVEDQVTVWYRDLLGRQWQRSLSDPRATPVPEAPALGPAATGKAATEKAATQQMTSERAAGELPASSTDSAQGTDGQE